MLMDAALAASAADDCQAAATDNSTDTSRRAAADWSASMVLFLSQAAAVRTVIAPGIFLYTARTRSTESWLFFPQESSFPHGTAAAREELELHGNTAFELLPETLKWLTGWKWRLKDVHTHIIKAVAVDKCCKGVKLNLEKAERSLSN